MTWTPDPPQGTSSEQGQIIIGRPPIPRFGAPQGIDGVLVGVDMLYEDLEIMGYEVEGWLPAGFQQRIPLTINTGQVPSTQTDFPLVINDTYPDLISADQATIRIAGIENMQLEYEIQEANMTTGKLIVWFKKPSVSDGDIIYIYFDNPGAIDEQNSAAVWSPEYKAVWHLGGNFLDSTSNGNDAINNGTTTTAGKIGEAQDFSGDSLEVADSPSLNFTKEITLSAWIETADADGWIMGKDNSGLIRPWSIRNLAPNLRFGIDTGTQTFLNGAITLSTTEFVYVTATYDGTTMKTYVNGVLDTTLNETGDLLTEAIPVFMGLRGGSSIAFVGAIDEPRISDMAHTADYIKTEFNNQNDQSTFYSTGTVESAPAANSMRYEN